METKKVWVVMSNDYPDAVFSSEKGAREYVQAMEDWEPTRKEQTGIRTPIHWKAHEFEVRR